MSQIDLKNARRERPAMDRLPPHDLAAERGALACILVSPGDCMKECAAKLGRDSFYDLRHQTIFDAMMVMYKQAKTIDVITVQAWLKDRKLLEQIGGITYLSEIQEDLPSAANLPYYLEILLEKQTLRKMLQIFGEAQGRVGEFEGRVEDFLIGVRADMETVSSITLRGKEKLIDVISPKEARAFEPDPDDFLIGDGLIMRGHVVTIGGAPGVGKSRLATSLAVAGARGNNRWQNYPVRSQWRTLILQTENRGRRLKEECDAIPKKFDDFIRISRSLPQGLDFGSAAFRRELLDLHDAWPFQMMILDPLNDIVAEDGQADYKEAMANISRAFSGRPMPAIVIVAHLRKPRTDNGAGRKGGRALLHEISGTLAIGSTSRTVFIVQAATNQMADDRIVFEVAKANDCKPEWIKEYGERSAWHRRNGEFEPCEDFDWNGWDNPGNEERRAVTEEMLIAVLKDEKEGLKAWAISKRISEQFNIGQSTAARAIAEGGYLRHKLKPVPAGGFKLK